MKVKKRNQQKLYKMFSKNWVVISNKTKWGEKGDSFWVLWNPFIWNVQIFSITKKSIHVNFVNSSGFNFIVTFFAMVVILELRKELFGRN